MLKPTVIYEGKPTFSYPSRLVAVPDDQDGERIVLVVEMASTDAMGNQTWITAPDSYRDATLRAAVIALAKDFGTLP